MNLEWMICDVCHKFTSKAKSKYHHWFEEDGDEWELVCERCQKKQKKMK